MDELQERAEIDHLVEQQQRDDRDYVAPEFRDMVPIDEMENLLGVADDGEIVSFERHEKGSVLTGYAVYHGTFGGYTNHKCRCPRCKAANTEHQRKRRAEKAA